MNSQKFHPLTHVIICLAFSSIVFMLFSLSQLCIVLLICFLYAVWRSPGYWRKTLRTLLRSLPFVLSLAALQVIFKREGDWVWQMGIFGIREAGLYWGALVGLRLFVVVLSAASLSRNTFQEFQTAFAKLHLPEEFAFMLSYGVQLIPGFLAQIRGFVQSLLLRGINLGSLPLKQRIMLYKTLAVSSLAKMISGSTNAAIALELRGFRGGTKRSNLQQRSLGILDWLLLLLLCCAFWSLVYFC